MVIKMETKEIIKLLEKIQKMEAVKEVEVTKGDFSIKVTEVGQRSPKKIIPKVVDSFNKAALKEETTNDNSIATDGQIKFTRDLVQKVFGSDERAAIDFMAHALEIPMDEIPDMESWETTLTRQMAGVLLDRLEVMYKGDKNDI